MTKPAKLFLCVMVLLTGVFNAIIAYAFMSIGKIDSGFTVPEMAAAAVLALPSVITVIWLLRGPSPRSVGVAAGLGLVNAFASVSLGSMMFLGAWNPGDAENVIKAIVFMVAPSLVVAATALVLAFRAYGRSAIGNAALGTGIAIFMDAGAGILAMVASFAVDLTANLTYGVRDQGLSEIVIRVQSCAFRYAEANPSGAYPSTLEDMGPSGSKCLDEKAMGEAKSTNLRYIAEGGSPPTSFLVNASMSIMDGNPIRGGADTGGTYISFESERDTEIRPAGTEMAVWRLAGLRNCALLSRHAGLAKPIPSRMDELIRFSLTEYGPHKRALGCDKIVNNRLPNEPVDGPDEHTFEGHRYTYVPETGPSGAVEHFTISARPIEYGRTGVNSYLLRDTGEVHRTTSDRAATAADAVIPPCTWADSIKTTPARCANLARPKLDVAFSFLHPPTIAQGDTFTMFVRDAKDTSRGLDPSLWIGFMCRSDSAQVEHNLPPPVSRRHINNRCNQSYRTETTPYPVLVFIRDSLGAVTWRIDSIPVRVP
jgi:hypothetical protein